MYRIIKKANGTYAVEATIQDGVERWEEGTLKSAIKSLKKAAPVLNGPDAKCRKRDIAYFEERIVKTTQLVPVNRKEIK